MNIGHAQEYPTYWTFIGSRRCMPFCDTAVLAAISPCCNMIGWIATRATAISNLFKGPPGRSPLVMSLGINMESHLVLSNFTLDPLPPSLYLSLVEKQNYDTSTPEPNVKRSRRHVCPHPGP